ncbi:hypothetical protein TIFTF001_016433 [Ficus carica]|uniref:Uncharacterized protein n=1 Tax=Ficus carica TaxID=3494 RepID=A0AA88D8R8_FICCA|nr:hypothetical protein TIFTF001_016433 [Ficus carica]
MISMWSEMMSNELGGFPLISLLPWAKISSLCVILVKMECEIGSSEMRTPSFRRKLPLLDLG